jgi:iron complex outermembrane receptor protein
MPIHFLSRQRLLASAAIFALLAVPAAAADSDAIQMETVTVIGEALYIAPSVAPVEITQPTSVVQEGFIQNNIIPQSSFDDIVKFEPSVYDQSPNGPGIGKSETLSLRGFQDGQYNVTFDGIPFGDATDLHHTSSALFIAHDLGQAEIDRGPGGGATIGKATFGGTMGFRTKSIDKDFSANPYMTYGSFNTMAAGLEINSGDTKLGSGFIDAQHESTDGYLTNSGEHRSNFMGKWAYDIDDTTTVTLLGSYNKEFQYTTQGATLANMALHGRNFGLSDDPATQAYYGYNPSRYYSDFYYADVKKRFGNLVIDNKAYTDYFAHVYTESKDPTDTNPADNSITIYPNVLNLAGYPSSAGKKTKDIPGKSVNARFRSWGDILNASYDTDFGTFLFGAWFDSQHDRRYSENTDLSVGAFGPGFGTPTPGKTGTAFSYNYHTLSQTWQPFFQFDWRVTDSLTLEPGVKYTDFHRHAQGPVNKGSVGALDFTDNYDALQPSIAARYAIDDRWMLMPKWRPVSWRRRLTFSRCRRRMHSGPKRLGITRSAAPCSVTISRCRWTAIISTSPISSHRSSFPVPRIPASSMAAARFIRAWSLKANMPSARVGRLTAISRATARNIRVPTSPSLKAPPIPRRWAFSMTAARGLMVR